MTGSPQLTALSRGALQGTLDALREALDADRCTLRLDVPGETFPVVVESRGPGVGSLVGEATVVLTGQPVVEAMLAGTPQVVQDDCRAASDDRAFQRMLDVYGGMTAQVVTAVRRGGTLRGIVSVHVLGRGPRAWTDAETATAAEACALVDRVLG